MQIKTYATAVNALLCALALAACDSSAPEKPQAAKPAAEAAAAAPAKPAVPAGVPVWTGDYPSLAERRAVRMLVVYSKTFYFIDKGQQRGITYDMGMELEKYLNAANKDRTRPIRVVFIPVARDKLLPALAAGVGDVAAGGLTITPERSKLVDFTAAGADNISEILVTGPDVTAPSSVDELSGRSVYLRASSAYHESLVALNARLAAAGKPPVEIVAADESLEDEDILEMVNAGLVDATVVDSYVADFWKEIFPDIRPQPGVVLRSNAQIAWAIRKDSPEFRKALDGFIAKNRMGTMTGNMLFKRYLKNTRWAKGATNKEDLRRFTELTGYFKKYATQYDFDWLLLAAQGYQESRLDQSTRSPVGAIGVMQVMPTTAGDKNVAIKDIHLTEPNIHAGVKYMRFLVNQYFDEPGIDRVNRHLFAFAAYNAGPNRITRLRGETAKQGLDPNKWFNNVEVVVAQDVGRETVQYVSNIYKY
ncbi:MAG TPA: lytic transglycosylase F, partial [Steroidobacteraceae bacterium]|nr:lytic transglycosylase F [Steroidobacteraceae bacterium]